MSDSYSISQGRTTLAELDDRAPTDLWIMSDIDLELTRGWDLPASNERPTFNVAIVAGDLIRRMERGVRWLAERFRDRTVLYVPGNHEFYGVDIMRTVEKARAAAEGTNVVVMQNDSVTIDGVTYSRVLLRALVRPRAKRATR
jgi:hypothetical protein